MQLTGPKANWTARITPGQTHWRQTIRKAAPARLCLTSQILERLILFVYPKDQDIQLSAFAEEIEVFDSEEDFNSSQTSELKFATQSFIPSGLFSFSDAANPNPRHQTKDETGPHFVSAHLI
jgi:hypothetical protein